MTKNPGKASEWTNKEIEADSAGYVAARKVECGDWAEAERDEHLALERWSRITAEDLDRARVVAHVLPIKDDVWR
jgi:hypothetical protein